MNPKPTVLVRRVRHTRPANIEFHCCDLWRRGRAARDHFIHYHGATALTALQEMERARDELRARERQEQST